MAEALGRRALLRLEAGRTRDEVVGELVARAATDDLPLVVGFDFSFSLPEWFLDRARSPRRRRAVGRRRGRRRALAPRVRAARSGDARAGRGRTLPEHLRATEAAIAAVGGIRPKSTFQIGGAGSVGTGSVRGWPALARLREAGFAIWPFDGPACPPVAVEIYPRALHRPGGEVERLGAGRPARRALPRARPKLRDRAVASEDAFDAAVSALAMSIHEDELRALPRVDDEIGRREGRVWTPTTARDVMSSAPPVATS